MFRLAILLAAVLSLSAQQKKGGPQAYPIKPDVANEHYGPHERNVFDLWKAKSGGPTPLVIHIHGGGFVAGDKSGIAAPLLRYCLENGISVASINYRYSTQAPYPAPMEDGARAVQYLRSKAREWNLNPRAFAATGGSAGAGISLWIGFHDDLADPNSSDPVKRQSTRLSAIGPVNGQTTYDRRTIAKMIDEPTSNISALENLYGLKKDEQPTARHLKLYEEASSINHLTKDDPPVFLYYARPMRPLPPADTGEGIHHPLFGTFLKERMDKLGIECQMHLVNEYEGKPPGAYNRDMVDFFRKHFPR